VSVSNDFETHVAPDSPILLLLRFKLRLERLVNFDNVVDTHIAPES